MLPFSRFVDLLQEIAVHTQVIDEALVALAENLEGTSRSERIAQFAGQGSHLGNQLGRKAAKLNGATEQEIQEAVAVSSMTRAGSVTLHGMQVDKIQFKKDVERIVRTARGDKK